MQPRDRASLLDIIEQIHVIHEHIAGVSHEAFLLDILRQDAIMRRIQVIGEAVSRLSDSFRSNHPEVEWRDIRSMRNFLVHVYDQIDANKVWDTVQQDLTPLLIAVQQIIDEDTTSE